MGRGQGRGIGGGGGARGGGGRGSRRGVGKKILAPRHPRGRFARLIAVPTRACVCFHDHAFK